MRPRRLAVAGGPETKFWRSSDKSAGEFTGGSISLRDSQTGALNLPTTLWLEGGGASSALRDVSIQYRYEVASHGNTSKDWAKATFLNVGTTVGCVEVYNENGTIEYGAVANLNDSDNDGTVDKDDGYVNGELDLISLTISNPTSGVTDGYLQLDVTGAVTVWKYPTKNSAEGLSDGELSGAALQWPLGSTTWPQTVYIEGTAAGEATAEVTYHPSSGGTVLFKTHGLVYFWATVEWEAYDNGQDANDALDPCTKNGGKKIYPGKKTHDDAYADDRRKVTVKAMLTPARDEVEVHFKVYDVDDPHPFNTWLDYNDSTDPTAPHGIGNDNMDTDTWLLTPAISDSNASGVAEAVLTVEVCPGDNYRVAAHPLYGAPITGRQDYTDSLSHDGDELGDLMPLTEMLTIWRRLHLELDSMVEGLDDPQMARTITHIYENTPHWFENGGKLAGFEPDDEARYEGGTLAVPATGHDFEVIDHWDHVGDDAVYVNAMLTVDLGHAADLVDDDAIGLLPKKADWSKLDDALKEAYVTAVEEPDVSDLDITFNAQNPGWSVAAGARDLLTSSDYWVVQIVSAWQGGLDRDGDPDWVYHFHSPPTYYKENHDSIGYGVTPGTGENHTYVFHEATRDSAVQKAFEVAQGLRPSAESQSHMEQRTVVHEIGHIFGSEDNIGKVMDQAGWDFVTYPDQTLYHIRRALDIKQE